MKTLWVWKRQGAARSANPLLSLACVRRLLLASLVALGEESMPTTLPDLPTCGAQTAINTELWVGTFCLHQLWLQFCVTVGHAAQHKSLYVLHRDERTKMAA